MWQRLEKIIPVSVVLFSLLILSPFGVTCLPMQYVILIHLASYLALGLCFELPELSFNALCLYWATRRGNFASRFPAVAAILRIRYVLTHFIGPTTGILTVASGIFLAYRGGVSFSNGWLFWILVAAAIGLYKGMYQHNLYVRHLLALSRDLKNEKELQAGLKSSFDQCLIFLELPTYIFIYWAASVKPGWFRSPFSGGIAGWENATSIWVTGALILVAGSVLLVPLKWGISNFSAVSRKYSNSESKC